MNKTVIIAASAVAVITVTVLAFYSNKNPMGVAFQYNDTDSGDFRLPEFIPGQALPTNR